MKKKFIYAITLCAFVTTAILNVQMIQKTNNTIALTMTTLESISDDENSTGGGVDVETGGGIGDEATCRSIGGYWNMALVLADGGISSVKCVKTGELSLMGKIINGSYTIGKEYNVTWKRYSCSTVTGNCCNPSAQDIIVEII